LEVLVLFASKIFRFLGMRNADTSLARAGLPVSSKFRREKGEEREERRMKKGKGEFS
jgi:hypothetical protein